MFLLCLAPTAVTPWVLKTAAGLFFFSPSSFGAVVVLVCLVFFFVFILWLVWNDPQDGRKCQQSANIIFPSLCPGRRGTGTETTVRWRRENIYSGGGVYNSEHVGALVLIATIYLLGSTKQVLKSMLWIVDALFSRSGETCVVRTYDGMHVCVSFVQQQSSGALCIWALVLLTF